MRIAAIWIGFLICSPASSQTADRLFRFVHTEGSGNRQELAAVVRNLTDARQSGEDWEKGAVTLSGSTEELDAAEWLFRALDRPTAPPADHRELFHISSSGEDIQLIYMTNAVSPRDLAEMATVVRSTAVIRKMLVYPGARAIAVRATKSQMQMAGWLFRVLDQPAGSQTESAVRRFDSTGTGDVTGVLFVRKGKSIIDLNKMATDIRGVAQLRQLFVCERLGALVVRGSEGEVAQAERLAQRWDK